MVYIYKKPVGDKNYYYLRASQRRGKKVMVKDIAYLGSSLGEVKKSLEMLPQHAEGIRKAHRTINTFLQSNHHLEKARTAKVKHDPFIPHEDILQIEACRLHFVEVFANKTELTRKEIYKNFVIEFAFNTASMEGNTIKLHEARNLIEEGLTPKDKTLREIYDIQNTGMVFSKIQESKEDITHEFAKQIHAELMKNIDPRVGYRTEDVHMFRANFKSTHAPYVSADMGILLKWCQKSTLHPIALASLFHHKFEKIHPFMDGNGRTGRMLMNYILLLHNYPPIIIHKKERAKYLEALRQADKATLTSTAPEHYSRLVQFHAHELTESYWNFFL